MRRRNSTAVCNPITNDRAVVREIPDLESDMSGQISDEVKGLLRLCVEQGFTVDENLTGNSRIKVMPADKSKPPVFLSRSAGHGRSLNNLKTELARAGLVIPGRTGDAVNDVTSLSPADVTVKGLLDHSMAHLDQFPIVSQMVDLIDAQRKVSSDPLDRVLAESLLLCISALSQALMGAKQQIATEPDMEATQLAIESMEKLKAATEQIEDLTKTNARLEREADKALQDLRAERKAHAELKTEHAALQTWLEGFQRFTRPTP